jgi:hypothetical protein
MSDAAALQTAVTQTSLVRRRLPLQRQALRRYAVAIMPGPHLIYDGHISLGELLVEVCHLLVALDHLLPLALQEVGAKRILEDVAAVYSFTAGRFICRIQQIIRQTNRDLGRSQLVASLITLSGCSQRVPGQGHQHACGDEQAADVL